MYVLVEIKGKQYRAETGSVLKVDRIPEEKVRRWNGTVFFLWERVKMCQWELPMFRGDFENPCGRAWQG